MTASSTAQSLPTLQFGGDVPSNLRVASAEGDEHGEGQRLPRLQVDAGAGVMVAEAVGGEQAPEVRFIIGRSGVHLLDAPCADDLVLHGEALLFARVSGPTVRAAPSMTRYSLTAWQAIMAASCTMQRCPGSRLP